MKNPFAIPNKPSALQMRMFGTQNPGDFTWEDWEEESKKKYPVRFFLSETLPFWWSTRVWKHLDRAWYWFVSHAVPKRRYHMLDLRQRDGSYRWGWIDRSQAVPLACFNLLVDFIEKEHGGADSYHEYILFQEEARGGEIDESRRTILDVYYYWTKLRPERKRELDATLSAWGDMCDAGNVKTPEAEELFGRHNRLETEFDDEETSNLTRLIKVRSYLWS